MAKKKLSTGKYGSSTGRPNPKFVKRFIREMSLDNLCLLMELVSQHGGNITNINITNIKKLITEVEKNNCIDAFIVTLIHANIYRFKNELAAIIQNRVYSSSYFNEDLSQLEYTEKVIKLKSDVMRLVSMASAENFATTFKVAFEKKSYLDNNEEVIIIDPALSQIRITQVCLGVIKVLEKFIMQYNSNVDNIDIELSLDNFDAIYIPTTTKEEE